MTLALRLSAIALLACAAACSRPDYSAHAFSHMTFSPSQPPQQSARPNVQYFKYFQRKPFKLTRGNATPVHRLVSWRRTFDVRRPYPEPSIVAVPSGVVFTTAGHATMLGAHGATIWQRSDVGAPIAAGGARVYAATSRGAVAIDRENGHVLTRYGSCARKFMQWLVPTADGVFTGCGSPQGDATLTTWSRSGKSRRQFTYRSGDVDAAGWLGLDARYALLFGNADGAQMSEREALVDLRSGRVVAAFDDLKFAGFDKRAMFFWSKTDAPGSASTLELHRMRLSDGHDEVVSELQLSSGDNTVTVPVSLYVSGRFTYFAYGDRLFRYAYPFRGTPDLVQSHVGPGPLFRNGFALMGVGSDIQLTDLAAGTERRLSRNANSLFFDSPNARVATWRTSGRLNMFDMRDDSFVSVRTNCDVLRVETSSSAWYLLCRGTNGDVAVESVPR